MKPIVFKMKVHPGRIEEYQKRHNPIWRELKELLERKGVLEYKIFYDPENQGLYAFAVVNDKKEWDSVAEDPLCRKWWDFMAGVMPTNPDNSPRTFDLLEVFDIKKQ